MIKIFACFLLVCVVITFGARRERISFARNVTKSELEQKFPFIVYVHIRSKDRIGYSVCTGTLIKPNRVLLAAHCFCLKGGASQIKVWSNTLKAGKPEGKYVLGYRLTSGPPAFNCYKRGLSQVYKDIAVIALHRKLEVEPVPLYCERIPIGENVTMIGFGYNEKKIRGPLRITTGETVPCPKRYKNQHCVYSIVGKSTILPGDSGGPLLMKHGGRFFQIGVTSVGLSSIRLLPRVRPLWNVWSDVRPHCQGIENAKSAGQRSAIGTTELVIQSFVLFFILNF